MSRHSEAEVADQDDVLTLDDRVRVAPVGGRSVYSRRRRDHLALVALVPAEAHARPLNAVGMVGRVIACEHGHPVVEQRASVENGDPHLRLSYAGGRRASTIFIR